MTGANQYNRKWTDDRIKLLRVLWVQNRTLSHIAGQMHPGCTEQAVKLKAYYLGLPPRALDNGPWSDTTEAYLKARWAEGCSASKIQAGLEAIHGAKVTRSAVIGKAHRLGCGRHPNSRPDAMSAVRKLKRKSQQNVSASWKAHRKAPVAFEVTPLPEPPPPSNFASAVKFGAREAHQCAYITHQVGSDVYCCGNEVIPGQSWCPSCHSRVYLPATTLRRRKEWADETTLKIRELQKLIAE